MEGNYPGLSNSILKGQNIDTKLWCPIKWCHKWNAKNWQCQIIGTIKFYELKCEQPLGLMPYDMFYASSTIEKSDG
jgi:hypothetical protein